MVDDIPVILRLSQKRKTPQAVSYASAPTQWARDLERLRLRLRLEWGWRFGELPTGRYMFIRSGYQGEWNQDIDAVYVAVEFINCNATLMGERQVR